MTTKNGIDTVLNYYRIDLINSKEMFVQNDLFEKTDDFIKKLEDSLLGSGFVAMKQVNTSRERSPVHFSKSAFLSIEKVDSKMISKSTKLWELV